MDIEKLKEMLLELSKDVHKLSLSAEEIKAALDIITNDPIEQESIAIAFVDLKREFFPDINAFQDAVLCFYLAKAGDD